MIAGYRLNSKSRSGEGIWELSNNRSFDPSSVSYMRGIFYDLANGEAASEDMLRVRVDTLPIQHHANLIVIGFSTEIPIKS
jgi:hypothetical protein